MTKIKIFKKFSPKLRFTSILTKIDSFQNFHQNWDFNEYNEFWRISKFSKHYHENRNFPKIFTKIGIFNTFNQIWDLGKILNNIQIFRKYWLKSWFPKILTKFEIFRKIWSNSRFFENFDQNRDFRKFWPKSRLNLKFAPKSRFLIILAIIGIFENCAQFLDFAEILSYVDFFLNLGFLTISAKIQIF